MSRIGSVHPTSRRLGHSYLWFQPSRYDGRWARLQKCSVLSTSARQNAVKFPPRNGTDLTEVGFQTWEGNNPRETRGTLHALVDRG